MNIQPEKDILDDATLSRESCTHSKETQTSDDANLVVSTSCSPVIKYIWSPQSEILSPRGIHPGCQIMTSIKRRNKSASVHPILVAEGLQTDEQTAKQVNYQLEKLVSHGVDVGGLHDEEEKWRLVTLIRGMAAPLPVRKVIRAQLLKDSGPKLSGFKAWKWQQKVKWIRFKRQCSEFAKQAEMWGHPMKRIEGYHGTGVLSYFVFMKWLLFLNLYIFLLILAFVIIPHAITNHVNYSQYASSYTNSTNAVNLANACSARYIVNVSSYARDLVQDFLQGTGWMEKTVLFYGVFDRSELGIANASFKYSMPLAYICVVIVCFFISLILMVRQSGRSFKDAVTASSKDNSYSKNLMVAWDFSMMDEKSVLLKHRSIYNCLVSDLAEQQYAELRNKRTTGQKCRLYTVRFIINLIVVAILGAGGYLIYYVTDFSTSLIKGSSYSSLDQTVQLLLEFLPSLTITALNGLLPVIFAKLVVLEEYSPGFEIKLTLIRTVFLKLASLAMLLVTLYAQITCSTKNSCSVGVAPTCTALGCWETYVGQQLYRLVITNFVVTIITVMIVEVIRKVVVTKCVCRLTNLIGPPEFDIPKNVLDLVYGQTICWLGFFFAPVLPALCVIEFFIFFYIKMFSALFSCTPSERPYKASRSNNFFMSVLLIAFFLCCVPIGFVIGRISPSKGCGPFRIYSEMYVIFNITAASWPSWLETIWNLVTSGIFIIAILILLGLLVYYYAVLAQANKEMLFNMKEQLVTERYDKQFLMAKVIEITGKVPRMGDKESTARIPQVFQEKPKPTVTEKSFDKVKAVDDENKHENTHTVPIDVNQSTGTVSSSQDTSKTTNTLPTDIRSTGTNSPQNTATKQASPEHVELKPKARIPVDYNVDW